MPAIAPVHLSGSGKYILLGLGGDALVPKQMIVRGGAEFNLHKDIFAVTKKEVGNVLLSPYGGGVINFFDETSPKRLVVSGSSLKYGPVRAPDILCELLKKNYPEYLIEVAD